MPKAVKSCYHVKWAQKSVAKKRDGNFDFKIFKYEWLSSINFVIHCTVSSGTCPNQLSRPYLNSMYEVPLKLIALVCLMSLAPKYFVV